MNTILPDRILLKKFYQTFCRQRDWGNADNVELLPPYSDPSTMIEPDLVHCSDIRGTIKIPGVKKTVQTPLTDLRNIQDEYVLFCELENHAQRRLFSNFVDVNLNESVVVEQSRNEDVEYADAQPIEIMIMMFHCQCAFAEPITVDDIHEWDLPYQTKKITQELWDTCERITVDEQEHADYFTHIFLVFSTIQQFERDVGEEHQLRQDEKTELPDHNLKPVKVSSPKRRKRN